MPTDTTKLSWDPRTWIGYIFRKRKMAPPHLVGTPDQSTETTGPNVSGEFFDIVDVNDMERHELADIYADMYKDPLVGPCVDIIIDYTVSSPAGYGCFSIQSDDEEIQKLAVQAIQYSGYESQLSDIIRDLLIYGDAFVYIDAERQSVQRMTNPYEIVINWDTKGFVKRGGSRALEGNAGYERYDDSGNRIAAYAPWEVLHLALRPISNGLGTSIFHRLVNDWQIYRTLEHKQLLASSGAHNIVVHYVPVPWGSKPSAVREYIRNYRNSNSTLVRKYDPTTGNIITSQSNGRQGDLYIPLYYTRDGTSISGKVDVVEGVSSYLKREDMIWWVNKVFSCLRVPPPLMYWDLEQARFSRGSMETWEEGWARFIHTIQSYAISGALDLLTRMAFLNYLDSKLRASTTIIDIFSLPWRSEIDDARAWLYKGQAVGSLAKAGLNMEWIAEKVLGMNKLSLEKALGASPDLMNQDSGDNNKQENR